jgi:hypothetical protein
MAIQSAATKLHWNFFLAIEGDVKTLSRFIEFHPSNFDCFSLEIARVLLAASSETDIACKQVCLSFNAASQARNINDYRTELLAAIPHLPDFEVTVPRHSLTLKPWDEWHDPLNGVPLWWTAHNKVKHERHSHYKDANLKNALNAVAGLFVILLYLYKADAERGALASSLFRLAGQHTKGTVISGHPTYQL